MATKRAVKCVDIDNHHWQKESLVRLIIFNVQQSFHVDFIISWPCWLPHECFHLSGHVRCQLRTDARLKNILTSHGKVELEMKNEGSATDTVIPFVDILVEWLHSHILQHLVWWCVEFCCMLLFNQDLTPAVELACPHQLFQTRTCPRQVKGLSLNKLNTRSHYERSCLCQAHKCTTKCIYSHC